MRARLRVRVSRGKAAYDAEYEMAVEAAPLLMVNVVRFR